MTEDLKLPQRSEDFSEWYNQILLREKLAGIIEPEWWGWGESNSRHAV